MLSGRSITREEEEDIHRYKGKPGLNAASKLPRPILATIRPGKSNTVDLHEVNEDQCEARERAHRKDGTEAPSDPD